MLIAPLFTVVKMWKPPKYLSIDEWIKKKGGYTYTMKYYSGLKKKEIFTNPAT